MIDNEYGNFNNRFYVHYSCSRYTENLGKIWDIELTDHNGSIWRKETTGEKPPSKEELIKSYWINKNSFNEVFLTLREEKILEEAENQVDYYKFIKEERKNTSDKRRALAAHNISFEEEKVPDLSPKFDNTL